MGVGVRVGWVLGRWRGCGWVGGWSDDVSASTTKVADVADSSTP